VTGGAAKRAAESERVQLRAQIARHLKEPARCLLLSLLLVLLAGLLPSLLLLLAASLAGARLLFV